MEKGEHLKRQNRPTMLQLQYLQGLSKVEKKRGAQGSIAEYYGCLLYTSPSPRDTERSRMPSSA